MDQIFVGNSELSTLGNAATGVVFPIFIIAQGFAWYFGDGSAAYINIKQGKGDTAKMGYRYRAGGFVCRKHSLSFPHENFPFNA